METSIIHDAIKEQMQLGVTNAGTEYLHVGLAGTENYIPHIGMVMMSLISFNPKVKFMYHLFLSNISKVELERLESVAKDSDCVIKVYVVNDDFFSNVVSGMYTASFFYRFIMPDVVANDTERLIYLDGDMMCCGDIEAMRTIEFNHCIAAVVTDRNEKRQMDQLQVQHFFNSGMMVINVKQWTQERLLQKIVDFSVACIKEIDANGRYKAWKNARYNDQNILNKLLDGRLIWLPQRYNYIYKLNRSALFRKTAYNEDYRKQVILHFAGSVKPWHEWVQDWPVVKEYRDIWLRSPWKDVPVTKPVSRKDFHQAAREYRVAGRYGKAIANYWIYYKKKVKKEK